MSFAGRAGIGALIVSLSIPALAQSPTRVRLVTPSASQLGQTVFMTAEVDTQSGGAPTGVVSFSDGARTLGSALLNTRGAGQATLTGGERHTCALTSTGGLKCWGNNAYGQLGDGTRNGRSTPGWVTGLTTGVIAVAAGAYHTCAVTNVGGVKCWGRNDFGQLGDDTNADKPLPTAVSGLSSGVVAVAPGLLHSCALTSDGAIKCWGHNAYGQLGNGGRDASWTPTPLGGPAAVYKALSAAHFGSCSVTDTGGVWCWGQSGGGVIRRLPRPMAGLDSGGVSVTSGDFHTCALTTVGALKCWGDNSHGAVGNGNSRQPEVLGLGSGVVAVDAGARHTCAILGSGEVLCWGANDFGQLGRADNLGNATPGPVVNLGGPAVALSSGGNNTCVVLATRVLRCWGHNAYGQSGDGTNISHRSPTTVTAFWGALRGRGQWAATFAVGSHPLRASYSGDLGHAPSSSGIIQHQVR